MAAALIVINYLCNDPRRRPDPGDPPRETAAAAATAEYAAGRRRPQDSLTRRGSQTPPGAPAPASINEPSM